MKGCPLLLIFFFAFPFISLCQDVKVPEIREQYRIDSALYFHLPEILFVPPKPFCITINAICFKVIDRVRMKPYKDNNIITYQAISSSGRDLLKRGWYFGTPVCIMIFNEQGILIKISGEGDYKEFVWLRQGEAEPIPIFEKELGRLLDALYSLPEQVWQ